MKAQHSLIIEAEDRTYDLELQIESLERQKGLLSCIENHSRSIDFGDIIEAYNLVVDEIQRLRAELKSLQQAEEDEEEAYPSSKYRIEHVVKDYDGFRALRPDDLYVENNEGVRKAFRMLYEIHKAQPCEEDEEESDAFVMDDNSDFLNALKREGELDGSG